MGGKAIFKAARNETRATNQPTNQQRMKERGVKLQPKLEG
jgi:hypothetical protein